MKRRDFIAAAVAAPLLARAQPPGKLKRVGWIGAGLGKAGTEKPLHDAFVNRMRELGWIEGRTIEYLQHSDLGNDERRVEAAARALVAAKVDLIFAPFGAHAMAVHKVTREIPIVFAILSDPVLLGLAKSMARPGENATGPSTRENELRGLRLQILRETVPTVHRVAILMNPDVDWNVNLTKTLSELCLKLGLESLAVPVRRREDFAAAIEHAVRERADSLLHMPDGFYFDNRRALVEAVGRTRLAATYTNTEYADDGGLMAYAIDITENMRKAAEYADKILRGAKPGDLPIEQVSRFEFVVNLKTSKAQGFKIPASVLLRATRVIE